MGLCIDDAIALNMYDKKSYAGVMLDAVGSYCAQLDHKRQLIQLCMQPVEPITVGS